MEFAQRFSSRAIIAAACAALMLGGGSAAVAATNYNLTFSGDASFHGPHGGQEIHVAVVTAKGGKVVAKESGTVSKTAVPSFSFTFNGVLEKGMAYDVDYWIDSNFGGGKKGVCDTKNHDHQWQVKLGTADGNVDMTVKHDPSKMVPVCSAFK